MLLLNSGARGKTSTCLVDLDFQHGACADYLDIEPRLNLGEIEPRPERLDRQLLEVMLSHHPSGLAVIAAPNRPAEMRSFDPDVVTRLLDLVSSHFDYVVFDMPRTWFSWTDSVLLGSNKLFIVSETTVPGLRHAKQLVDAIRERLGDGPKPQVIINRFEQKHVLVGLAPRRHRAGDRRLVRGLHPQRLRAGARGDRPRRAARRGQAGQQDHAAAQEADRCRKAKARRRKPAAGAGEKTQAVLGAVMTQAAAASAAQSRTLTWLGRFSTHRVAAPEPGAGGRGSSALEGVVVDGLSRARAGAGRTAAPAANPLLTDKLLDAKVRLHRRLIEEINLSALEKLPEDEMRSHIQQLVSQYVLVERLALNTQELNDFVSEILDEMTGLGPLEPLLKDPTVNDILINGHECVYVERARHARADRRALQGRGASAAHHQQDRLRGRPPGR